MGRTLTALLVTLVVSLVGVGLFAKQQRQQESTHLIKFHALSVDTTVQETATTHRSLLESDDESETTWMLHVSRPLTISDKAELEARLGRSLGPYVPDHTYLVVGPRSMPVLAKTSRFIDYVGEYPMEAKLTRPVLAILQDAEYKLQSDLALVIELSPRTANPWTMEEARKEAKKWSEEYPATTTTPTLSFQAKAAMMIEVKHVTGWKDVKVVRQVINWIAKRGTSHTIGVAAKLRPVNYYSSRIVQSGLGGTDYVLKTLVGRDVQDPTIWDSGITGAGEIIAIADTGLDYDHCFFRDNSTTLFGKGHRKIIAYVPMSSGDTKDAVDGHGTHVIGSAVGNPLAPAPTTHRGIAYNSKVVVQDIGIEDVINPPSDLGELFTNAARLGANIHSNSWACNGENCNEYDYSAKSVDSYVWGNKQFLVVFAAGNEGTVSNAGTVSTPATAKNLLSVGAAMNPQISFINSLDYIDFPARVAEVRQDIGNPNLDCCATSTSIQYQSYCCQSYMAKAYKTDSNLWRAVNLAPFSARGPTADGRIKPEIVAPGYSVVSARSDGDPTTNQCEGTPSQSVAALLSLSGTSQAVPFVSGSAALVREYLRTGRYTAVGSDSRVDPLNPSAALISAFIANSGVPLGGRVDANNVQTTLSIVQDALSYTVLNTIYPPDVFQGFGRIQLAEVLLFTAGSQQLFFDDQSECSTGIDFHYSFLITGAGEIKVTLTWSDYPGEISAAESYVNNLDLVVGNTETGLPLRAGNYQVRRDTRNNIEQVIYPSQAQGAIIVVTVRGYNVPQGPQPFALLVRGPITPVNNGTPIVTNLTETNTADPQFLCPSKCVSFFTRDYFPPSTTADTNPPHKFPWSLILGLVMIVLIIAVSIIYVCIRSQWICFLYYYAGGGSRDAQKEFDEIKEDPEDNANEHLESKPTSPKTGNGVQ